MAPPRCSAFPAAAQELSKAPKLVMMETRSAETAARAPATFNPGFHALPQEQSAPPYVGILLSGA